MKRVKFLLFSFFFITLLFLTLHRANKAWASLPNDYELISCSFQASWNGGSIPLLSVSPNDYSRKEFSAGIYRYDRTVDASFPFNTNINFTYTVEAKGITCQKETNDSVYISIHRNLPGVLPDARFDSERDYSNCEIFTDSEGDRITIATFRSSTNLDLGELYDNGDVSNGIRDMFIQATGYHETWGTDQFDTDQTMCRFFFNLPDDMHEREDHGLLGHAGSKQFPFELCQQIPSTDLRKECCACQTGIDALDNGKCFKPDPGYQQGIWTAIGCIRANPEKIVEAILEVGLSIAGGAAILMILAASFMLSTSQGDPKRTSEARELITSAVIGILFIVFSVAILQFIGYDILRIPGFGG